MFSEILSDPLQALSTPGLFKSERGELLGGVRDYLGWIKLWEVSQGKTSEIKLSKTRRKLHPENYVKQNSSSFNIVFT